MKKITAFFISLLLILNSALSHAFAIRQWTISNPMAVGASMLYDGSKGTVTSSVLITPNASQVAKVLRGGGAGFALSYAVKQLLGAVGWVMDSANNRVTYYKYTGIGATRGWVEANRTDSYHATAELACIYYAQKLGVTFNYVDQFSGHNAYCFKKGGTSSNYIYVQLHKIGEYNGEKEEKTLSLETIAQKVIENAESDNLDAQFAVLAAANNILSEAERDDTKAKPIEDELENNAKCPSGIVRNGSCWICDKSQFMPITRATRDAKTAARGKSCEYVTDPVIKATNAVFWRNLINARIQENACWSPVDPNHLIELNNNRNALSKCEN